MLNAYPALEVKSIGPYFLCVLRFVCSFYQVSIKGHMLLDCKAGLICSQNYVYKGKYDRWLNDTSV